MAPKAPFPVRHRKPGELDAVAERHRKEALLFDDDAQDKIFDAVMRGEMPKPPVQSAGTQHSAPQVLGQHRRISNGGPMLPGFRGPAPVDHHHAPSVLPPPTTTTTHKATPAPTSSHDDATRNDTELLSVMCQRLRTMEGQCTILHKELKQKSVKASDLEDKVKSLQHDLKCANEEKVILAQRLAKMHKFLSDYGLQWAGDDDEVAAPEAPPAGPPKPINIFAGTFDLNASDPQRNQGEALSGPEVHLGAPQAGPTATAILHADGLPFDLEKLKDHADRLTATVGFTGVEVAGGGRQAGIKERTVVYVAVYRDGISVNSGPFRPYGWPLCDAFLNDILDGYFPYEFKDIHPDGFPITVVDRSTEACPTAPQRTGQNMRSVADPQDHGHHPLTKEELLKRIPVTVITASGKIINPRAGVDKFISGPPQGALLPQAGYPAPPPPDVPIVIPTDAGEALKANASIGNVASIQARMPSGHKVLLHLFFHATIQELKEKLYTYLKPRGLFGPECTSAESFELSSVFPRKVYEATGETLQQAGLIPNCTVHLRMKAGSAAAAP